MANDFEYWNITDQPDYDNIKRILGYLSNMQTVPGQALDAIEGLLSIAYPGDVATFTCAICGAQVTAPKTPGKKPSKYCGSLDCEKEATRRRVAKHRTGKGHSV